MALEQRKASALKPLVNSCLMAGDKAGAIKWCERARFALSAPRITMLLSFAKCSGLPNALLVLAWCRRRFRLVCCDESFIMTSNSAAVIRSASHPTSRSKAGY